MTWTLKAHVAAGSTNGSDVTTAPVVTTGADICFIGLATFFSPTITPVDSAGNTYVLVETIASGTANIASLYYASATTGAFATSAAHTFTQNFPGSNNFPAIFVFAFSGSGGSPVDQVNQSGQLGAVTSMQPGSVTPSQAGELLVTVASISGPTITSASIDSGFTNPDFVQGDGANRYSGSMGYFIQGTAAALNPTWSWTPAAGTAACVIGTFKGAAGAAACQPGSLALMGIGCSIAFARKLEENPIMTRRGLILPRRRSLLLGHNGGPPLDE